MIRKKLIAGNWKMNKTSADAVSLAREIVFSVGTQPDVDVVVALGIGQGPEKLIPQRR